MVLWPCAIAAAAPATFQLPRTCRVQERSIATSTEWREAIQTVDVGTLRQLRTAIEGGFNEVGAVGSCLNAVKPIMGIRDSQ